ncbi:glycerophosphodiester phosphodiesterase family protein [Brevundimonas sp. Sa3CVA3]|uniref:Glycerophosphodiester phosphodiesterase family protein n=1 Tax=Brevundimonas guildfordensis TaxID=2762241 RepID=A0ABR8R176_9CAUL|nr:glycerophosphodiester phosphodiesterase family protein [Brevundimonas guildfordensis]
MPSRLQSGEAAVQIGASDCRNAAHCHKVEVAAHRGLHMGGVAPENSLDAYRLAARAGFDLVETDLQATSDGVLVLMHDSTLNRTCRNAADYTPLSGTVRLDQTSFADLRANYVLAATDPAMRRPVPTLAEFVQECRAVGVVPLIEFKGHMPNSRIDQVISETVPVLGWDGVVFIAFVHNQIDYIRSARPLRVGLGLGDLQRAECDRRARGPHPRQRACRCRHSADELRACIGKSLCRRDAGDPASPEVPDREDAACRRRDARAPVQHDGRSGLSCRKLDKNQ